MRVLQPAPVPRIQHLLMILVWCTLALFSACSGPISETEPTPVLSGPPSTTFPMPPVNQASLGDLGWVLLEGSKEPPSQSSGRAKISDYQGKVLVLDFYATWCAPCRESIPELIELQRRYEAQGLAIVGLNVGGADDRVKVAAFAQELGINYSLGFPDQALSNLLLADDASIPQTYVFSREGKLVKRFMGYGELARGKLEEVIKTQVADNANSINRDGAQR